MPFFIRVSLSEGRQSSIEVTPEAPIVVGRGAQCQLRLGDESLSRTHCRFFWEQGSPLVEDLDSTNGTFVNGVGIRRHKLQHGDIVALGQVSLLISLDGDLAHAPEPRPRPRSYTTVPEPISPPIRLKRRVDMGKTAMFAAVAAPSIPPEFARLQRDLATIYRVVNVFTTEHDLNRLFGIVIDTIMEVTGADRGSILMRHDESGPLEVVASRNSIAPDASASTLALSQSIVDEGLKGLSLITDDAFTDERFRARASIIMQNIHAVMCVPLESHDKILGVIYVDTIGGTRRFSESDLELLTAVGRQAGIAIQRAAYLQQTRELLYSTVQTLAMAIEAKDRYTRGHSERVTQVSVAIAETMGLDEETIDCVRLSALLHDVGKIGVAESILNKRGALTNEEYAEIQTHPAIGSNIVQHIPKIGEVLHGVKHHHEKWNGKGYPDRLAGHQIPLVARIISVADAYDAMSSHRIYRKGLDEKDVFDELQRLRGIQFDPACVDAFFRAVDTGRIARPKQLLADQAAFKDLLVPPENSDAQGLRPPPDAA